MDGLQTLSTRIQNCQKCPLHLALPVPLTPIVGQGICRFQNSKSGKIFIIVDKPSSDCILLQQPLEQEHVVILNKICKDINLNPSLLHITNILKCPSEEPIKENYLKCSENLKNELDFLNPSAIIVCGKVPQKWWKKTQTRPYIELPSLHILFSGKNGIERMRHTLRIIKDTYIG